MNKEEFEYVWYQVDSAERNLSQAKHRMNKILLFPPKDFTSDNEDLNGARLMILQELSCAHMALYLAFKTIDPETYG